MKIDFADRRPDGDYALVVPVAGKDRAGLKQFAAAFQAMEASLNKQRFEGEEASAAEVFFSDGGTVRRLVVVGTGAGKSPREAAEKLGGTAVSRLLTSGETRAVIDVTGLGFDADAAGRLGLAAALRSWRHDRYRTKLKDKQKPTLKELTIVGAGAGASDRWEQRWKPVFEGVSVTRELVTEPANIIYPETFVERTQAAVSGLGLEVDVLDGEAMRKLG